MTPPGALRSASYDSGSLPVAFLRPSCGLPVAFLLASCGLPTGLCSCVPSSPPAAFQCHLSGMLQDVASGAAFTLLPRGFHRRRKMLPAILHGRKSSFLAAFCVRTCSEVCLPVPLQGFCACLPVGQRLPEGGEVPANRSCSSPGAFQPSCRLPAPTFQCASSLQWEVALPASVPLGSPSLLRTRSRKYATVRNTPACPIESS